MISELNDLLRRAGLPSPYILVGHSFGGLLVRAYANLRPNEVAGLVLIDPVSLTHWANCGEDELSRLRLATRLSRRGAFLARLGVVRAALAVLLAGGRRFPKLVASASAGRGSKVMENLVNEVQRLPREMWPIVRAHWCQPRCFRAMAAYLARLPENARTALQMPLPPPIPLIVLSASTATEQELAERDSWVRDSDCGKHIRLDACGHWIQLEKPEIVIAAVQELVERARKSHPRATHP